MAKNDLTPQAIDFAMRTLKLSSDQLLYLVQSAEGFEGESPYDKWLAHQIIVLADDEGVPFSQIPLKWTGFLADIKSSFDKTSVIYSEVKDKLKKYIGTKSIGFGGLDSLPGLEVQEDIDWFSALDLNAFEASFVEHNFESEVQSLIFENEDLTPWSIVGEVRSTKIRKTDLQGSLRLKGFQPSNVEGEQILFRLINLAETSGLPGCKLILQTDFDFWSNIDELLWNEFTSFFQLEDAFLVHPSELYADAASFKNQLITVWSEGEWDSGIEVSGLLYSRDFSQTQKEYLENKLLGTSGEWWLRFSEKGSWEVGYGEGLDGALSFGADFGSEDLLEVTATIGLTEAMRGVIADGSLPRIQTGLANWKSLVADAFPVFLEKLLGQNEVPGDLTKSLSDRFWSSMQIEAKTWTEQLLENPEEVNQDNKQRALANIRAYYRG